MQLKTFIVICIVVVLLLGGGIALWLMLQPSPAVPPQQNEVTPGAINNQTSVTVPSSGGQTSTQDQTPPNIDQAYAVLFEQLLAQKVPFVTVSSAAGETASIYALYANDIADSKRDYPGYAEHAIQVALVDLNEDNTPEALVLVDLPGYCGTAGCSFDVYQKSKTGWTKIFTTLTGPNIGISNTIY